MGESESDDERNDGGEDSQTAEGQIAASGDIDSLYTSEALASPGTTKSTST